MLAARKRRYDASGKRADILEIEPRVLVEQLGVVAVADVAEEIRLEAAVGEEGLVDDGVVEAAHRADIEADRPRGDQQIGALQGAVAEGGPERHLLLALADVVVLRRRIVREGARQVLVE